ncbi:hypothetical protein ACWCOV_33805 [Kribbella sp. NPDC002412]
MWHRRNPRPLLQTLIGNLRTVALPGPPDLDHWVPDPDFLPVD